MTSNPIDNEALISHSEPLSYQSKDPGVVVFVSRGEFLSLLHQLRRNLPKNTKSCWCGSRSSLE